MNDKPDYSWANANFLEENDIQVRVQDAFGNELTPPRDPKEGHYWLVFISDNGAEWREVPDSFDKVAAECPPPPQDLDPKQYKLENERWFVNLRTGESWTGKEDE